MSRRLVVGLVLGALAFSLVPAEASHTSRVYLLEGRISGGGLEYTASGKACVKSCAASAKPGSFSFFGKVTSDPIIPCSEGRPPPPTCWFNPVWVGVGTMDVSWPDDGVEGIGSEVWFSSLIFTPRLIVGLGSVVSGARRGLRVAVTIAFPGDLYLKRKVLLLGALVFV